MKEQNTKNLSNICKEVLIFFCEAEKKATFLSAWGWQDVPDGLAKTMQPGMSL